MQRFETINTAIYKIEPIKSFDVNSVWPTHRKTATWFKWIIIAQWIDEINIFEVLFRADQALFSSIMISRVPFHIMLKDSSKGSYFYISV